MKMHNLTLLAMTMAFAAIASPADAIVNGTPVFNPGDFTAPSLTIIDYSNSPVGVLPGSTSITNQYAAVGALHDGSTTTPPGPPGMSSASGLPGLESNAGDPNPDLPITVNFTVPVNQIGVFYLMGGSDNSITMEVLRADNTIIDSVTVLPADMPLQPGPFSFNEGFLGLIVGERISAVTFAPGNPSSSGAFPFVIDDLYFGVPEPSALGLIGLAAFGLAVVRRRRSPKFLSL